MGQDLQKLQDMLGALQVQRDQALNVNVMLQAEISALKRALAEHVSRIAKLEVDIAKMVPADAETPQAA